MLLTIVGAQKPVAVSEDGRVLATYRDGGFARGEMITKSGKVKMKFQKRVYVDIWSTRFQKKVCSIAVLGGEKSIRNVKLSPDGRRLYVEKKNGGTVWETKTGHVLASTPRGAAVAFSHRTNIFVVLGNKGSAVYDALTGSQIQRIRFTSRQAAREVFFSEDDRYFVLIDDRDRITVFERGKRKPIKKFSGRNAAFGAKMETFTYYKYNGSNAVVYSFKLPGFERTTKLNCAKQVLKLASKNGKKFKRGLIDDPDASKLRPRAYRFVTPSPDGKYVALVAYKGAYQNLTLVVRVGDGKVINTYETTLVQDYQLDVAWEDDQRLQVFYAPDKAYVVDVTSADQTQKEYDYLIQNTSAGSAKAQRKKADLSTDQTWRGVSNGKGLFLKNVNNEFEINWPKSKWLEVDQNDRYLYVKGPKSSVGYVRLDSLQLGFTDVIWMAPDAVVFKESVIEGDDIAPKGYHYQPFRGVKQMDETEGAEKMSLELKAVETMDSVTSINVQMFDEHGNHYSGASEEEWRKTWCNLMLKSPDGTVKQVSDFEIIEHHVTDTIPIAFAVVMDFSGSMGEKRALTLQKGVRKMAINKRPIDAMSIIKYDTRIRVEQELTKDSLKLIKILDQNNYHKYKKGTSMLDATNAALGTLQEADGFGDKVIILMTDGMESGSFATPTEVIVNAQKQGVRILTVGYGQQVDMGILEPLSYNTGGRCQRIYRGKDLDGVFDDLYARSRIYYEIRIKTKDIGQYRAVLKTCLDVPSEKLVVDFEVNGYDLDTIDVTNPYVFSVPVKEQDATLVENDATFSIPDITDFSKITISKPGEIEVRDTTIVAELNIVEAEFEQLDFPHFEFDFDKTTIVAFEEEKLEKLEAYLHKYPEIKLDINGHTDSVGRAEYNMQLSDDRAQKVKDLIVARGIDADRLTPYGFGSTDPIATNDTDAGRLRNRRVGFSITEDD